MKEVIFMPKQFTTLQVGTPFELFYGRNMQGQCGCIMEQIKDGFCFDIN